MSSPKYFIRLLAMVASVSALSLLLNACDQSMYGQNPSLIFADGRLPRILEKLANQFHELRERESIVQRVQNDKMQDDLLRVAVIDNGVDFTHPDISSKIAFSVKDGRIVGAGRDILGGDDWASPQLIKPVLFAFGAQGIVNGKIVGAPENPLELIAQMNNQFMQAFARGIQADPLLANSLFGRLTADNFSIVGATILLESEFFTAEAFRKVDPSESIGIQAPPAPSGPRSRDRLKTERRMQRWLMATGSLTPGANGLPAEIDEQDFAKIEQAERFRSLLETLDHDIGEKSGYHKALASLRKFMAGLKGPDGPLPGPDGPGAVDELGFGLLFKREGPKILDPLHSLNRQLWKITVSQAVKKEPFDVNVTRLSTSNIASSFTSLLATYESDLRSLEANQLDLSQKAAVRSNLSSLYQIRALKDWYIKTRGWERSSFENASGLTPTQVSLYRRYLYRSRHPFLDSSSASVSHGTHVSGIISAQDERIRIFPVRVLTSGIKLNASQKTDAIDRFTGEFKDWLKNPLVFKAVSSYLHPIGAAIGETGLTSKDEDVFVDTLLRLVQPSIQEEISKAPIGVLFPEQIVEAIKVVGQQKIRVANISLGDEFEFPVMGAPEGDPADVLRELYPFLRFEFLKYKIGSAMQNFAPDTIFVIAAGNSGKWIDGKSHSALPVDVTSPFLEKHEDLAHGLIAPNNHLKNIIGVGSLNADGDLSSFTNLLLSKKIPFVVIRGESVLSSIRSVDLSGPIKSMSANLKILSKFKSVGVRAENPDDFEASSRQDMRENVERLIGSLSSAAATELALQCSDFRGRMSGTSMASPGVAGLIAKHIIQKSIKMGVKAENSSAQFAPETIIREVLADARNMQDQLFIPLKEITGEKFRSEGQRMQLLKEKLSALRNGNEKALADTLCHQPAAVGM